MLRWLLGVSLVMGCAEVDASSQSDSSQSSHLSESDSSDLPSDLEGVEMTGYISDSDGNPVAARVNMCMDVCFTVNSSSSDGAFHFFPPLPRDDYWFYVVPFGEHPELSATSVPLSLVDHDPDTLARDAVLPSVHGWVDAPQVAEELELAPGLFLEVGQDNVEHEFGYDKVTAARVEIDDLPDVPFPDGEPVAAWYLQPLEARAVQGRAIPFRILPDWEPDSGDTFRVYAGKYAWELRHEGGLVEGEIVGDDLVELTSILVVRIDPAE
ncbi:MAG: hypothetical protein EA397_00605 [Deltaproteobacteria bacterium]|nr:MAG: hypothetical protein EA397_00605 [Deltaproteobacteria bacterium]